ncbi:hypothetical protein BH23CHL1_BH23CHL1_19520 [soil metagenome]
MLIGRSSSALVRVGMSRYGSPLHLSAPRHKPASHGPLNSHASSNVQAREPLARHIADCLWELREESSGNIYRVFYIFYARRWIVFLHEIQKKSQKTPRRKIAIGNS